MNRGKIYVEVMDKYGEEIQKIIAIEEMSELTKELCKSFRPDTYNKEEILREMADVLFMIEQLIFMYKFDLNTIESLLDIRAERINRKLNGE